MHIGAKVAVFIYATITALRAILSIRSSVQKDIPYLVLGNTGEPFMESDETAQQHLDNALAASLAGNETELAVSEFEKALELGLPGEKESFARVLLGGQYSRLALGKGLPLTEAIVTSEWNRAESEITNGLGIDREGRYGVFSDRNHRAVLNRFDLLCELAGSVKSKENSQLGIEYIETMLGHCDYLPSSPLLHSLFHLGHLYRTAGNDQKALQNWDRLIASEPVDYIDQDGREANLRRKAQENIDSLRGSNKTSEPSGKGCIVLIALLSVPALLALAIRFFGQYI
jgi:tetratricopeptide (TPR) repeat protein